MLTGGCGLAGIDVADNDHVDVHLFLTAGRRHVSRYSIFIVADDAAGVWWMAEKDLTDPMLAVLDLCRFVCGV